MPTDLTAITYFAPIAAFLIVFAVVFAILLKTKILGEHKLGLLIISFIIATLFISAAGAVTFIRTIIPWFAVLVITLVFLLMVTGLIGKPAEFMNKGIGVAFVIILGLVFLVSGFFIFSYLITPYLPGPGFGIGGDPKTLAFADWLYSPRVAGAILLVIISVAVSWVLVKTK